MSNSTAAKFQPMAKSSRDTLTDRPGVGKTACGRHAAPAIQKDGFGGVDEPFREGRTNLCDNIRSLLFIARADA
ncbi:MAG TPA: hypothetical protein V6D47_12710 [Oscillatoriaceae cyanobacterium]